MVVCVKCHGEIPSGDKYIQESFGPMHTDCFVCPHCNEKIAQLPRHLTLWAEDDPPALSLLICRACHIAGRHKQINATVSGSEAPSWQKVAAKPAASAATPAAAKPAPAAAAATPHRTACPSCGAHLDSAKFCGECGTKVA